MKIDALLAPLGIAAYAALAVAFLSGFLKFQFQVRWVNLKWHIWAGILAMVLATLHLALYIFINL